MVLRFVCFTVLVNTLNVGKFTVLWMDNGDVYKVTKELTTQLLNKVGKEWSKLDVYTVNQQSWYGVINPLTALLF